VPVDDDVSIDELRQAVEHLHGVPAKFIEAVEVDADAREQRLWFEQRRMGRLRGRWRRRPSASDTGVMDRHIPARPRVAWRRNPLLSRGVSLALPKGGQCTSTAS
jgi:hypothetical protein